MKDLVNKYLSEGSITGVRHSVLPLTIYKYTRQAQYEKRFDGVLDKFRGLVLDDNYRPVNNTIPKFFNYQELGIKASHDTPNSKSIAGIYEKYDGSIINVFKFQDKIIITSMQSFESDMVKVAEDLLPNYINDELIAWLDAGWTFVFEVIYPENRIVVNYGDNTTLVLLAVRNVDGTEEFNLRKFSWMNIARKVHMPWEQLFEEITKPYCNKEGYVVVFGDGSRVKFKYNEYFELHAAFSDYSKKRLIELAIEKKTINPKDLIADFPDELYALAEKDLNDITELFIAIYGSVGIMKDKCHGMSIKEIALEYSQHKLFHVLMSNIRGKDTTVGILKLIKDEM